MSSLLRWYLKKSARQGVAAAAWASGTLAASGGGARVRVLTYHRFGDSPRDPFCVHPRVFAQQMDLLADAQLAVSLVDVQQFLRGERALRDGSVLVTVDDGFVSLYEQALPVLRDYRIPAVAFVSPGLLADNAASLASAGPEPYLSWPQLEILAESGIAIGSHAWSHRSLGRLPVPEAEQEAVHSRAALEARLQRPVTAFAYPYGRWGDFNAVTARVLAASGYCCAFTSQHGAIGNAADPFVLPRIKIESGEGLWLFRLLTRGGLDSWQWVDRHLWRLQAGGHG